MFDHVLLTFYRNATLNSELFNKNALGNMPRRMSDLWPVCFSVGTEPLAAWCGSSLPFSQVLFSPHTYLGKMYVNHF